MRKLSNTETELKKSVAYKKKRALTYDLIQSYLIKR